MLNVKGYFDSLLTFLDGMNSEGFLRSGQRDSLIVDTEPEALLEKMENLSPTPGLKWDRLKPSSG